MPPSTKAERTRASKPEMRYVRYEYELRTIPPGRIVVHNSVRPAHRVGTNGFRVWLGKLSDPAIEYEVCPCGWAPHLGTHYRVKRNAASEAG